MKPILVTNIQRFSLHDGPGIRTTVFLKGCSLHCPWCSNPENISNCAQSYIKDGQHGRYGDQMSCDTLFDAIMKDNRFFAGELTDYAISSAKELDKLPGGVTFSGGEPLLRIQELEPLLKRLNESGVHTAVETCLYVSSDCLNLALKYIDLFYVDIKILDKGQSKVLGGNVETYLSNIDQLLKYSDERSRRKPVVVRVPVIGGYTDNEENIEKVTALICEMKPLKVELLKEHNLGLSKYHSLNLNPPEYKGVSDELIRDYKAKIDKVGVVAEICSI